MTKVGGPPSPFHQVQKWFSIAGICKWCMLQSQMSPGSCNFYANYLGYRKNNIYRAPVVCEFASMYQIWGGWTLMLIWGVIKNSWWQFGHGSDEGWVTFLPFSILPPLLCWLLWEGGYETQRGNRKKMIRSKIGQRTEIFRKQIWVADGRTKFNLSQTTNPGEDQTQPQKRKKEKWKPTFSVHSLCVRDSSGCVAHFSIWPVR